MWSTELSSGKKSFGFCVDRKVHGVWCVSRGFRLEPDVYVYTAVVRSFCELKDCERAKEMMSWVEKKGFRLNVVTYNVLINGLCKSGRLLEAVEIIKELGHKDLRADVITYCTLVLGFRRVEEFAVARDLVDEMVECGGFIECRRWVEEKSGRWQC